MLYGLTVTPTSFDNQNRIQRLDGFVLPWILGVGKARNPRDLHLMRALARVSSVDVRREQLLVSRIQKLQTLLNNQSTPISTQSRKREQLRRLQEQSRLPPEEHDKTGKQLALDEWLRANNHTRNIPALSTTGPPAIHDPHLGRIERHSAVLWYL